MNWRTKRDGETEHDVLVRGMLLGSAASAVFGAVITFAIGWYLVALGSLGLAAFYGWMTLLRGRVFAGVLWGLLVMSAPVISCSALWLGPGAGVEVYYVVCITGSMILLFDHPKRRQVSAVTAHIVCWVLVALCRIAIPELADAGPVLSEVLMLTNAVIAGGLTLVYLWMFLGLMDRSREETALALVEARAARDAAERAANARGRFLAVMSHEIRTPMNGIIGASELILDTELTADQKPLVTTVLGSGLALVSLINDILDFSRMESEAFTLQLSPLCLRPLCDEIVLLLAARIPKDGPVLTAEFSADVPEWLMADGGRLRQVLLNLVGNAVKFTERGSVKLMVTGGKTLRFEVIDTGPGIPADRLQDVFDVFSQVEDNVNEKHRGTGLGLAISRQIVEAMGARILLESELGVGTRIWFDVDLAEALVGQAETDPFMLLADNLAMNVLLVDDNRVNRMVIRKQLEALGCEVEEAENGRLALQRMEAQPFDVVLMDYHMPVMNGLEATRQILKRFSEPPPVLGLTADVLTDDHQRCLDAGMRSVLTKPIRRQELAIALSALTVTPAPVALRYETRTREVLVQSSSSNRSTSTQPGAPRTASGRELSHE